MCASKKQFDRKTKFSCKDPEDRKRGQDHTYRLETKVIAKRPDGMVVESRRSNVPSLPAVSSGRKCSPVRLRPKRPAKRGPGAEKRWPSVIDKR